MVEVRPVALGGPDTRDCRLAFTAEIFGPGDNMTDVVMTAPPEGDIDWQAPPEPDRFAPRGPGARKGTAARASSIGFASDRPWAAPWVHVALGARLLLARQ